MLKESQASQSWTVSLPFGLWADMAFSKESSTLALHHSPTARAENYLLYTRIKTFSYTTRVKKPISAQRPNGKETFHSTSQMTYMYHLSFWKKISSNNYQDKVRILIKNKSIPKPFFFSKTPNKKKKLSKFLHSVMSRSVHPKGQISGFFKRLASLCPRISSRARI